MACKRVGKIYKILINDDFYIGSTFDFDQRLRCHKSDSKTNNQKLYKAIRDNNNQFEMTLLYKYECYTDTELRMEERRCYDELKPNLNMLRPYISKEEFYDYNKQYNKEYNIKNRETNTGKHKEKIKKSYIKNREKQLKQTKERRDNNKYICGCGSSVINANAVIKKHEQTKKHQKYLLEI